MQHRRLGLLGLGALFVSALVSAASGGCQATGNNNSTTSGPGGPGGSGGATTSTSQGGAGGTGGMMSTGGSGGTGGSVELPVVTIQDITTGAVPPMTDVQVQGVIAMSPKYLVSQSNSGNCLWGVYVSAPGLTETEAYSGVLALSYGTQATTNQQGDLECPRIGTTPAGDAFPDDVRPGDVLTIAGETSQFLLNFCGDACGDLNCDMATETAANCREDCDTDDDKLHYRESTVQQRQLFKVEQEVMRTGTAPVPTPHVLTGEELLKLSAHDDQQFHDMWGGVKVRIEGAAGLQWSSGGVVSFGRVIASIPTQNGDALIRVYNDIYYRRYAPTADYCHKAPVFTASPGGVTGDPVYQFSRIDGFSSLGTCIWVLQAADPCADLEPYSESCMSATDCSL